MNENNLAAIRAAALALVRQAELAGVKWSHLAEMEVLGLVVSRPVPGGNKCEWQLEHLVLVPEGSEA